MVVKERNHQVKRKKKIQLAQSKKQIPTKCTAVAENVVARTSSDHAVVVVIAAVADVDAVEASVFR